MVVRIRVTRMTLVAAVCLLAQLLALPLPATSVLATGRGSGGGASAAPTAPPAGQSAGPALRHPSPRAALLDSGTPLPTDVPTPTPSAALSATASATPADTPAAATAVPSDTTTPPSPTPSATPSPSSTPTISPSSLTASVLGAPLAFALNEGQTDPSVSFLAQGPGYTLFLNPTAATLATVQAPAVSTGLFDPAAPPPPVTATVEDVIKLQYSGANAAAPLVGQEPFTGTINYLQGSDPNAWLPNVATYGQVVAQGVYPGIDLVYYGTQGQLETDWRVGAGADPSQIAFTVAGADGLSVDGQGNLRIATALGTIIQQAPVAYQEIGGQRQPVAAGYTLSGGRVGFSLGSYDPSQPLVIDPVLSYSTYLGGSGLDYPYSIAVDAGGAAYVAGYTASIDYPTTTGAFSTTSTITQATYDAFVTKLTPQGNKLSYSTYLGGSAVSYGHGLAVDAQGDAYVVGYTQANDFPTTTNAYSQTKPYSGNSTYTYSMFLSELNPSGSGLLYSTYFGANKDDFAYGVALDTAGHAYVVGAETSSGQATSHGHQTTNYGVYAVNNNGATNGYWAVFDPTQSGAASLLYGTYIGGTPQSTQGDAGYGIAVDPSGNVYLTGGAGSLPTLPLTPTEVFPYTPYDPAHSNDPTKSKANRCQTINSNSKNVFVAKYFSTTDPATYTLDYVDYLGGGNNDAGYAVAADAAGNAYVTGRTSGTDFPITNQGQTLHKGPTDAFVAKVNFGADGCVDPLYATFLGGSQDDEGLGITVDAAGKATVVGQTNSITDFPTTSDAVQPSAPGGAEDAFVTTLDASGQTPTYSTYLGGSGTDAAMDLAQDAGGSLYVTGVTNSTDFITTTGAYSTSLAGNYDGFVTKLGSLQSGTVPWHAHHSIDLGAGLSLDLDLSDGHVDLHADGMDLPGRGPDLVVNQTWDSTLAQRGATSGAGTGWVSTLTPAIGGSITGTLTYTDGEGTVWPFLYLGSITATLPYTTYQTPAGYPWALTATTSGYSLTNILSSEVLNFDTNGRYFKDVDAYGNANTLSYNSSGPISLTNSGGRALTLYPDASGRLLDIQSPLLIASGGQHGQQVAYSYTPAGQLGALIHGYGTADAVTTTFGYSGTQLLTVTTPLHQSWLLGYDSQGRISSVTSPVSGTLGQAGYTPAYLTAVGYASNQTTLVEGYGAAGQQLMIYTLDAAGEPTVVTDGLGHSSVTFYDADHDVTYSQDANRHATTTYYQYVGPNGSTGLVTETLQPAIAAYVPGNQTLTPVPTFHYYNATNDLIATVSPEGGTTYYGYDGHHGVVATTQQTNPLPCATIPCPGQANQWQGTVTGYDQYGELTSMTDGRGVSVSSTGAASLAPNAGQYTQHTTYDTQGDVQAQGTAPITTTLNGVTQASTPVTTTYGYDADGNQTSLTTANGATSTYSYDHLGRQTQVTQPSVTLYTGGGVSPTTSTRYDGDDRVTQQTDANGDVTQESYDPLGRLTSETNPVSGTTVYTYNATEQTQVQDPMGNVSTGQYDAAGRLLQASNPTTGTVQYAYDAVGNVMTMTTTDRTNGSAVTLASMAYDALNRVITSTVVTNTATGLTGPTLTTLTAYNLDGSVAQVQNPKGDVAYYTYNAADQLTGTEIDAGLLNPTTAASHATYEAYGYDAAGNVTSFADSDGRTTVAQYDGDNHVAQGVATSSGPAGTTVITTTPSYDPNGNTVSATTATQKGSTPVETHTVTDTYNTADWETATGDDGQTTSYGYDAAGQVRSETSGDGLTVAQANYDGEGRVTSISESAGGAGPYATQYTYNANDLPRTIAYPNGVQVTAGYDPNSALTSLALSGPNTGNGTTTLNTTYTYSYNAAGWTTSATTISGTDTITHDATGRLTDECGAQVVTPNGCYHWTYDPNGNVLSQITDKGTTEVYTYSQTQPNEVVQSYAPGYPDATTYYSYDSNGDITAITAPVAGSLTDPAAINTALFYDAEDRPITVTHLDKGIPITATLGYNAMGLRDRYTVVMSGTAITDERFTYRDGQIAQVKAVTATLNGDGSVKSTGAYTDTYLYGASGEPLEFLRQQNGATNRYWYVLDGQGSVVAVTDSSGAVVDRYNYDSWGEPIGTDYETVPQQMRYAGYWWDSELEWYWLTARYYDPEDLHYQQPDPSDLDGVHTYAYVGNDPIDYVDPSGLNGNGIVNNVAQDVIDKLIQRILDRWMYTVYEGSWSPPGNQNGGLYRGIQAHKQIAAFYRFHHLSDLVYTNNISIATILQQAYHVTNLPRSDELGNMPDILNATQHVIYEIKPYEAYGDAVKQLVEYIGLFGLANVTVKPGPSDDPGVTGIVSAPRGYAVFVSPAPGTILYRLYNGQYNTRVRAYHSGVNVLVTIGATAGATAAFLWGLLTGGVPSPARAPGSA